jgi:NAD(P)-dependent dehydrogenase (short-subunit alcohol dehydrogenase family)
LAAALFSVPRHFPRRERAILFGATSWTNVQNEVVRSGGYLDHGRRTAPIDMRLAGYLRIRSFAVWTWYASMPLNESVGDEGGSGTEVAKRRVALVTGASRGIGAAIAEKLATQGYAVVLAARSHDTLADVANRIHRLGGKSVAVPTDISVIAQLEVLIQRVESEFGYLDVLVNNAAVLPDATRSEDLSLAEWQRAIDLNLTAPWYLASRCKRLLTRSDTGGVVVNVTSTAAFYPSIGFSAYNASKAGLTMLTKTLALEWARDNIRVLAVAPGKVDTDMVRPILEFSRQRDVALNPLGRLGEPSEVAAFVSFLVSDEAAFITGSVMTVDGGEVLGTGADVGR